MGCIVFSLEELGEVGKRGGKTGFVYLEDENVGLAWLAVIFSSCNLCTGFKLDLNCNLAAIVTGLMALTKGFRIGFIPPIKESKK